MGVLDVPAPLFEWLDGFAASLPTSGRLILWGVAAGTVTMLLYALLSPQKRLARAKRELADAKRALDGYDGDFAGARPLLRAVFVGALRPVRLTLVPAVLSGLPVILVAVWLSTSYGYAFPSDDDPVGVEVEPETYSARWIGQGRPGVVVLDEHGYAIEDVALRAPVTVVAKPRWWNALIGNPAGYLPRRHPVDAIRVDLPRQHHLGFGPPWLRGWEALFFAAVATSAVLVKAIFGIE